jgi:hypothetical protein
MPRIQFSDVTPPERRSIRDIPIPRGGRRKTSATVKIEKEEAQKVDAVYSSPSEENNFSKKDISYSVNYSEREENEEIENPHKHRKSKKKTFIFGSISVIAVVVFIVSMMTVFASATIYITPKSETVSVDTKIPCVKEVESDSVRYEIIKLAKSKSVSVQAAGEKAVEIKASGKIRIFNNFSTEPQRLIVRTRFESPEGLVYRIPESVIVPGKTVKNGTETPGSIEVEIFADEAGEKYNIKKSDFTIPGFKTDANRYKNFYARATTEMTGGFIGNMKTVTDTDKNTALQSINSEIEAELKKELSSKIPEGLTLLPGAITYESKELAPKEDGSSVSIGKEITAYAMMLNSEDLSKRIVAEYVSNLMSWEDIKPEIKDFSGLEVSDIPKDLENAGKIDLQITGTTKVWAKIDTNAINQRLLGAPKKDAAKLMDEFAGISGITSTIRPIWKQTFPKDSFKIYVRTASAEQLDTN